METSIGGRIKELRLQQNMTLKELGEKVDLSISFLSQFERGNTTIAIDALMSIADALNADIYSILQNSTPQQADSSQYILRSYQRSDPRLQNQGEIQIGLSSNHNMEHMLAREITILPSIREEKPEAGPHSGEEFIYVLEGIVTLILGGREYRMAPGDTAHFPSTIAHTWYNESTKAAKMLVVNSPNPGVE